MNGSFSDKALSQYSELLRAAQELAFSEGSEFYDFTRCVRPDGTAYGTGGKCRKGSEQAKEAGSPTKGSGSSKMSGGHKTPHQIARLLRKNFPKHAKASYNKENNSAKVYILDRKRLGESGISSGRIVDEHLQDHGQMYNFKHDKVETFTDKGGNRHTITPDIRNGVIVGHTIEISTK